MDPKSKRVGTGLVGAPACGDVMKLQIEVPLTEVTFSLELIDFFLNLAIKDNVTMIF